MARGYDLTTETLVLDGKEARGVRRMSAEALLPVSAFSGLTVALGACLESQEVDAVRTLLRERTLAGRVVTADAVHTQRETAQLILDGGDYVFTVKGNHSRLAAAVRAALAPERAADQDCELART